MNATVQKWGNSLALRIPNSLAKDVRLHQGSVVEVAVVDGKMVVKPKGRHKYSLVQLLRKVTKNNRHNEIGWGSPVGQEIW
ncbi:MAG: AbrB/MazE/SpoVT family DNA-binding domain-containing protein [Candidatus Aureabacteria bacterium]|nr:AbrB/MazE/SpoVT family DNA-binding domain-containing protein [Candidatus Auribacterota bacterium]